jgi:hypothetical protein
MQIYVYVFIRKDLIEAGLLPPEEIKVKKKKTEHQNVFPSQKLSNPG